MKQRELTQENTVIIDIESKETITGRLNLPKEKVIASATVLANKLLDFMKNGGDMEKLSPKDVFGR